MKPTLLDLLFLNRKLFSDVIPESFLRNRRREVNLAEEFFRFAKRHPKLKLSAKDAVNPKRYPKIVEMVHKELGIEWSYGGWLENRKQLFADTYLKETGAWIHLGIDINVPVGTPVLAALVGKIHKVGSDYPEKGGWGCFVVVEHKIEGVVFYSIYGHLASDDLLTNLGSEVTGGQMLGKVGAYEENGFWRPHTHFQFISAQEMRLRENPWTLDGYGKPEDLSYLRRHYPNPLVCLPIAEKK